MFNYHYYYYWYYLNRSTIMPSTTQQKQNTSNSLLTSIFATFVWRPNKMHCFVLKTQEKWTENISVVLKLDAVVQILPYSHCQQCPFVSEHLARKNACESSYTACSRFYVLRLPSEKKCNTVACMNIRYFNRFDFHCNRMPLSLCNERCLQLT